MKNEAHPNETAGIEEITKRHLLPVTVRKVALAMNSLATNGLTACIRRHRAGRAAGELAPKAVSHSHVRQGWRADLLHLAALAGAFAGLAIVGRDVAAIGMRPAESAGDRAPAASRPANGGSFPAPVDLKGWTEALATCAKPGPRVREFVKSFPGGPAEKMAAIYAEVARAWIYEPDSGRDRLTPAEVLVQPGMMRGDCKHVATLLYACAVEIGITARMVVTGGHDGGTGHVRTEILLCRPQEDPTATLEAMSTAWKATQGRDTAGQPGEYPLNWTADGVFLILDGGSTPSKYQQQLGSVEAIISSGR
jgi:hypothetical protein